MNTNYNSGYNRGNYESHYQRDNELVAYSTSSERAAFYRKTYTHVALAILAFILVETALLQWSLSRRCSAEDLSGFWS